MKALKEPVRIVVLALIAFVLVGVGIYFTTNHDASASTTTSKPVQLVGTWIQTSGMSNVTMTATITDNNISIEMGANNETGLYWVGTFDTSPRYERQFVITSVGDTDAMRSKLLASLDSTKDFTYKDGDLSFHFSIMGVSSVVHLKRSPA